MAFIQFSNVGISAVAACVPPKIVSNRDLGYLIPEEEIQKTIESIGILEKHHAEPEVCSSDLCFKAAQKLFADNDTDPSSINALIFLSQTPDYITPATAPVLQHRLGLSKDTLCFDINMACSGYIYGLSTAFAYACLAGIDKVLLLVGETFSKITNPRDKINAPLYGDAGTATLVEKGDFGNASFLLQSNGEGKDTVIIPAGGFRNPTSKDNIDERECEEGNIRSPHQIFMDGMDVFNFAMSVVPKSIRDILARSNLTLDDIDYVIFHQANKFMTDFFSKRLKCPEKKVIYCLHKYGNTSAASIPLTISSELHGVLDTRKAVMCGFGGGLSWGSAVVNFHNCRVSSVIDY